MKKRVARGKEKIDARLDLHGYTQSEAHSALLRFLRNASERDARLVLVVTGKGSKNLGRGGEPGYCAATCRNGSDFLNSENLSSDFKMPTSPTAARARSHVRVRRVR